MRTKRRLLAAIIVCLGGAGSVLWAQAGPGLSLHEAVEQALRSPQTAVLDADVQQAQGVVKQAGLGPNPKLYLQSEDLRPWDKSYDFANQTESYIYLGQTIEISGKRGKRVALAKARLQQSEADRTMLTRELIGRVTGAYWTAVSQQRVVGLLRQDMNAVEEMVAYHQKRVDEGAMRGVDLLRMQMERDRLSIALRSAERDAQQSRLELFRQMGVAASNVPLSDPLEDLAPIDPPKAEIVVSQRPDIQAVRAAEQTAEADLRLQQANAIPDPDLFAGYKRNNTDNTAYGGLQLQLPFRNRNQGEVERARAAVRSAQARLAVLEQQARTEAEQAYASYLAQREIVEKTLPDMRKRSRQNLDIVSEAYRIGGMDLLRFIDAERTQFEVEVSAVRAMAQLQQSVVQLRLAYGVQP